jgi:hypothetical protein
MTRSRCRPRWRTRRACHDKFPDLAADLIANAEAHWKKRSPIWSKEMDGLIGRMIALTSEGER